ncbi:hypothetical protein [Gracilibacillus thailandensis]|uniref:Uncharacterized protein n=1 Tax=Gracilibacillus thailandensis TaxID=563735 RepID=A0A6N7QZL4_9BACI|nr:hypothetical protein [Gracilibacillus thailandensis]MRI65349.1 hypothetical protein [Gracilibacillus thailandensis]
MKCIAQLTERSSKGAGKTELINSQTLEPIFAKGGVIKLTTAGYKLTTEAGEVIRRGKETDVISVVEALEYVVEPLTVKDEIRGVELPYDEYETKYNHGKHFRSKQRKFYVNYEKDEAKGVTTLGIAEKAEGLTYAIHSIYEPQLLNRKERSQYVVDYIANLLHADEFASVQGVGIDKPSVKDWLDKEHVRVRGSISSQVSEEETAKLAKDAMQRKATVVEKLAEPIKYEKEKTE